MRPVRDLKNLVHRLKAIPGAAPFRQACQKPLLESHQRVYHYHIRKTAGTSLNQAFLSIAGESGDAVYKRLAADPNHRTLSGGFAFLGWTWGLIEQGRFHYAFSHYAAHQIRLPPGTFTVTCLRDPVSRLISYYAMLCEMREQGSTHGELRLASPWLGSSMGEFLERAPRSFLSMQLFMFSSRFDVQEAVDGVLACDAVLFTERYAEGVRELGTRLNLPLPVLHIRPTQKKPVIHEDELRRARDVLAAEYDMLSAVRAARGA